MELLNLLDCAVPSSALGKGVCYIYDWVPRAVSRRYFRLPVLEPHAESTLVDMHKALLFLQLLIDNTRTAFYAVHKLTDTLADMLNRLSEHCLQFALYFRRARQYRHKETHHIHICITPCNPRRGVS